MGIRTLRYNAFYYDNHADIIFRDKRLYEVRASLPPGTRVYPCIQSTIGCCDGGDYDFAWFENNGRIIIVQRIN
jgi:hypothetical protein